MTQAKDGASRWLPLLILFLLGSLWGGSPSFAKALALEGLQPVGVVFWQTAWAGLMLVAICAVRRKPIRLSRKHLAYYGVVGGFGLSLSWAALVFVTSNISASFGAIVVILSPVLTYTGALLFRIEPLRILRVGGIAVGFIGAGFLVFPQGSLPSPDLWPVALFAIVIPGSYATMNIYAYLGRPADGDNIALAAGTIIAAMIVTGTIGLFNGGLYPLWEGVGREGWILLGYSMTTAASFVLYFWLISLAGVVFVGQVGFIATLTGVAWGIIIFGEAASVWMWVAIAIVFVGVGMVNYGRGRADPAKA